MEAYKRFVRRNKEYANSLDSLASGVIWLLPDQFSESEIGAEAVTSIFGIINAINEHIIETTPIQIPESPDEPSSFPYSLCITCLKGLDTLVEVVAQQFYGDDKKWNFIAIMETIKVLVRLALFRSSGYKMLLNGGETVNEEESSDYSILFVAGELMFILRPLVYVLLIRNLSIKSWFPWLISLFIDLIGNRILALSQYRFSDTQNNELKRRRLLWAFYIMRDPLFTKYIRHRLDSTEKTLEPVPVIGYITGKFTELIVGVQTRYTYISGS